MHRRAVRRTQLRSGRANLPCEAIHRLSRGKREPRFGRSCFAIKKEMNGPGRQLAPGGLPTPLNGSTDCLGQTPRLPRSADLCATCPVARRCFNGRSWWSSTDLRGRRYWPTIRAWSSTTSSPRWSSVLARSHAAAWSRCLPGEVLHRRAATGRLAELLKPNRPLPLEILRMCSVESRATVR